MLHGAQACAAGVLVALADCAEECDELEEQWTVPSRSAGETRRTLLALQNSVR